MVTSPDMTIERATGTSDVELLTQRRDADRVARLIVTLVSIGEMLVAVAILALPREVTLLLVDASLDGRGLIVARMMGIAVLALGMTWWMARRDADGLSRYSADSSSTTSVSVRFSAGPLSRPFTLRFHGSCAACIL